MPRLHKAQRPRHQNEENSRKLRERKTVLDTVLKFCFSVCFQVTAIVHLIFAFDQKVNESMRICHYIKIFKAVLRTS